MGPGAWSGPASSLFAGALRSRAGAWTAAEATFRATAGELSALAAKIDEAKLRAGAAAVRGALVEGEKLLPSLGSLVGLEPDPGRVAELDRELGRLRAESDAAVEDARRAAQAAAVAFTGIAAQAPAAAARLVSAGLSAPRGPGGAPPLSGADGRPLTGLPGAPPPADDYLSWRDDPERQRAEYKLLYGAADPAERSWDLKQEEFDDGVLRIAMFIQAPEAGPYEEAKLRGDSRGFDSQFSPTRSRNYIEIDFEKNRAYVMANPTCEVESGECHDAKAIGDGSFGDSTSEMEFEERDDGSIHLSWESSQSAGVRDPLFGRKLPVLSGASIDGDLNVRPLESGGFEIEMDGDDFPSWEAYYDDGEGNTHVLIQEDEDQVRDLIAQPGANRTARTKFEP